MKKLEPLDAQEKAEGLDASRLPTVVFGHRNVSWLGNVLYMLIEGMMFALVIASYFYLRTRSVDWPPAPHIPPRVGFGIANAAVLLLSLAPARWIQVQARTGNRAKIRLGLLVLAIFGVIAMVIRGFEFTALNCRWTDNAYASVVWILLGMHTGHLITEWIETMALWVISFTPRMSGTRLPDASTNSDYWYFVVASGLVTAFVIYGTTRFL
jgi:heme/copper-type cytochrome/quinol oxidase subunit 3